MGLEIIGNTVNGGTAKSGFSVYSNFAEESTPSSDSSKTGTYWRWNASTSNYGHVGWGNQKDVKLKVGANGATSSTGGTGTGTIYTQIDLRKYKEFYFAGCGKVYVQNGNDSNVKISFGIRNNGSNNTLQGIGDNAIPSSPYGSSYTMHHGWFVKGKFEDNQLHLTYGGFDSLTETTTVTVNGKIEVFAYAKAWSEYNDEGKTDNSFNICLVK